MVTLAANLSMLFTDVPMLDRFAAAAAAGFPAVEVQFLYDLPVDAVGERLERAGLPLVLHNLPAGDWAAGERGLAADPARLSEFRDGVGRAVEWATALGIPQLNCLVGRPPAGLPREVVEATLVANLRFAAEVLERADIRLLTEPANTRDVPGYFLTGTDQAARLIQAVDHPNLALQYDVYHMQIMEGDLAPTLERHLGRIGHIQIADTPGRHEPGTGEIDYPFLLDHLDRIGYRGCIGCEYHPATTTEAGLGWARRWLKPGHRGA